MESLTEIISDAFCPDCNGKCRAWQGVSAVQHGEIADGCFDIIVGKVEGAGILEEAFRFSGSPTRRQCPGAGVLYVRAGNRGIGGHALGPCGGREFQRDRSGGGFPRAFEKDK